MTYGVPYGVIGTVREFLENCAARVYRFAPRLTRDHARAEDLAQETLLCAWSNRKSSSAGRSRRLRIWNESLRKSICPGRSHEAAPASRRLRVAWLLQADGERLRPPPEDLKEIVEELARSGVGGFKLVAQPMIGVMTNGTSFTLDCSLDDPQAPIHLGIKGSLIEKTPGIIQIQLSVEANQQKEKAGAVQRTDRLFSLSTVGETPAGHPVVLCVTPTGEKTSAFVVQAMP